MENDYNVGIELTLMDLHRIKEIAIRAGALVLEIYDSAFEVKLKADETPLTKADLASNDFIIKELHHAYPDIMILSEESKEDLNRLRQEWLFIVDPLDGTKEFVKRNGEFTINIALIHRQRSVLGVVHAPVKNRTFYALKDLGAYEDNASEKNLCIGVTDKLTNLILVGSASHQNAEEKEFIKSKAEWIQTQRLMGSAIKGCLVACGEADVYYRFGKTCEWDTAAMQVIVEEAGGIFKELNGKPMIYNRFNLINDKGFFAVNRKENIWTVPNLKL